MTFLETVDVRFFWQSTFLTLIKVWNAEPDEIITNATFSDKNLSLTSKRFWQMMPWYCIDQAPDLWRILSTPHSIKPRPQTYDGYSALHTQCIWMGESWVWSVNPECKVLNIHHKFWVQALNLWQFLSTLHLKLQHQLHVFEWGILKCGRIHILCSGIPNQIHGVLSIRHKFGARSW